MQPSYQYRAHVTNVVDGDTIDATVDLGFTVSVSVRFRLNGLDTPELTSSDPSTREAANKAKQFVTEKIKDKDIILQSVKQDKYGRWLANIYLADGSQLNQILLENHLAVPYSGGAKP